ncbi:pol protein [Cucumis melo var. makuwa]|uniref:Pol protein n=1 Tax=Cucumis melo var. makuwa TaxID=1194695 RepID=A0A5D3CVG0_CUCMM|nr:pol protein [Cucumis melo var. makuwa]TYK14376.1 pol protein [Cucumis melo var. makuwa]
MTERFCITQPTLRKRIIIAQLNDPYLVEKFYLAEAGQDDEFSISSDDELMFERRLCIPIDNTVKTELFIEAHRLPRTLKGYTVIWVVIDRLTKSAHFIPGKSTYSTILERTSAFLGHEVRFQHSLSSSDKWSNRAFEPDFGRYVASFCAGDFGKLGLSFAFDGGEVGEQRMLGPKLVQTTNAAIQKIRARILIVQSRQKSYADERHKDLQFDVGDMVFLKVAPMKGVLRFKKKGKLSPRFVGPFEILERVSHVAYRLALSPSFSAVYDVFHVSILRKYIADPTHVVDFEPLQINESLSYEEQSVKILAREVKMLRNRGIALVKVLWQNHRAEEVTWEREDDIRA